MQVSQGHDAAPGVRRIQIPLPIAALKIVNVYLVEGDDRSLVDTGIHTDEAEAALRSGLAETGVRVEDIARTYITHLHPDHFGMAGTLERAGSSIVMHRPEAERARDLGEGPPPHRRHVSMVRAARDAREREPGDGEAWIGMAGRVDDVERIALVDDGGTFDLGGRNARVVWTPGHTDHHAVLFDEDTGTLFAGDHVLPRYGTSNIGLYSFSRDDPLGDFLGSLARVRALPVRRVLPAHGEPFDDLAGRVDELLEHHRLRLDALLELATGRDAYTIARLLFPRLRSPHEERFALAETLAHLRHLERTDRVVPDESRPIAWRAV